MRGRKRGVAQVPKGKVAPRILRKIAPPEPEPQPAPPPKAPARELPSAPTVQPNASQPPPTPAPKIEVPTNPVAKLEAPEQQVTPRGLVLPKNSSPRRTTEASMRATKPQAPMIAGGGPLPSGGPPGGGGRPGQA